MTVPLDLVDAELVLTGRILAASNATFAARLGEIDVVYKPVSGERPLWDFPEGNLARREVASYLVSQALGWKIVPRTWLQDGPHGCGMVQLWQQVDPKQEPVTLVSADKPLPVGWCHVLDGTDAYDRPVSLIHEDSAALRRIAVFDIITNNADRKGSHILAMDDGHRYGIDHGLTFHVEHKLRTILWGWLGQELDADEIDGVQNVLRAVDGPLGDELSELLTEAEVAAVARRCERLLREGTFPAPRGAMPAIPWPPL